MPDDLHRVQGTWNVTSFEADGRKMPAGTFDNSWTICLATRGNRRPKTFATKAGTGLALETLEPGGPAR